MPKCGQLRVGAAWVGGKEPDIIAPGRLRYYDKRCRTRIIMGATVRGQIAKNSIFRVRPGNGNFGTKKGRRYQDHFRYYDNVAVPGSPHEDRQTIFRQAMTEIKNMTEEERAPYKAMAAAYFKRYRGNAGTYKARIWTAFYLMERLPQLWPIT